MTTLLEAADLAWMQDLQQQALPGTAVILRCTLTPDGMGGQTEAWQAAGTAIARLYGQNSRAVAELASNGAQVIAVTRWYVTLPAGTDVTAADRLSVAGRLFEVTEVNNDQDWRTALRCAVVAMNEETA